MVVVPRATSIIEPRVAVDDDVADVAAARQRVAHTAGPAVGVALLEPQLQRVEVAVERGQRLLLVELEKRGVARSGIRQRDEGACGIEDVDAEAGDASVGAQQTL